MSKENANTTEEHPSKRRRTDSGEGSTRSRFWFKDGNVVLEAQNTQFRVHRSILSNHSIIFHDMFELAQPDERPLIEGCPTVQLSDLSWDVEHMICMFYDNMKAYDFKQALPLPVVLMMIRLGRKYQIEHFVKDAMDRLHHDYPATYKGWLDLEKGAAPLIKDMPGLGFLVVHVAQQFSLQTILTAAYIKLLSRIKLENILQGIRLTSGHLHLDSKSLTAVILGRDHLIKRLPDFLGKFSDASSEDCDGDDCEDVKKNHILYIGKNLPVRMLVDPYSYLVDFANVNLCDNCAKEVTQMGKEWDTWRLLPKYFNVPPWDDQKDFHL